VVGIPLQDTIGENFFLKAGQFFKPSVPENHSLQEDIRIDLWRVLELDGKSIVENFTRLVDPKEE
jgi:hypothetical protein